MTNIPMATLRIWERRYGFPDSARTEGGHRLYSEKQVAQLRWVKARTDEGMQAGQAVRALQHMVREGRLPEVPITATPPTRRTEGAASLAAHRERLTRSLLSHDVDKADQILGEAMSIHPLEAVILEMIVPTLSEIGQGWVEGRVNVATEHLATNYVRHRLQIWTLTGPTPYPVRPTLLACAPGELHEGSLLILGAALRRKRWPVAYLGQSLPLPDLAALVKDIQPPVVVLVAMMAESAQQLIEWPRWLPDAVQNKRPVLAYGGRIFTFEPQWREKMPGVFLGETLQVGIENLDKLLCDTTSLVA